MLPAPRKAIFLPSSKDFMNHEEHEEKWGKGGKGQKGKRGEFTFSPFPHFFFVPFVVK
jgi:hypothetical protein